MSERLQSLCLVAGIVFTLIGATALWGLPGFILACGMMMFAIVLSWENP